MNLAAFRELLTPTGQAALETAARLQPAEETFLTHLTALQKQFTPELAKAALETILLRGRARSKFRRADQMYFTREALEQASGETVSRYRAERFAAAASLADLGCGIGGDTLALAQHAPVAAVESDALRLAMAEQNAAAYGQRERVTFIHDDVTRMQLPRVGAFFFDPARRVDGRRRFSVHGYQPPLSVIDGWLKHTPAIAVKISPGVDWAEIQHYAAEVEFISESGELKECVLWFGPLRSAARRASLLPGRHTLTQAEAGAAEPAAQGPPLAYLYEPDPAVLRAGLVTTLAARLGARQLDPDIAYLTADSLQPTPFARAFVLDEALPFQLKRLRERLRQMGVGQVTVKKRGSPLAPEALIRQLRLAGPESRVVFLTHVAGRPYALIGRPA